MVAKLIDGSLVAQTIKDNIAKKIKNRCLIEQKRAPGLAVILVGGDPASKVYVNHKRKACERVGILSFAYEYPDDVTESTLSNLINSLNNDEKVDGILLQLPLPKHLDADKLVSLITADKDVDGFHPFNIGNLALRKPIFRSCTPMGVISLLDHYNIEVQGKHAVVVGASNHVGRPMLFELLLKGATTTSCHRFTKSLESHIRQADILIAAVGKPNFIPGSWVKDGAVVIDIGINRTESGKLTGDVEFDIAKQQASWITPVPGGVGPMTVASLMQNTLLSAEMRETSKI